MVPFLSIARAMLGGALGLLAMIPALANPVAFDPHGKRIGLNVGSPAVDYVERHYPDAKILLFQAPADTIAAVKFGKVDATILDAEATRELLRHDDSLTAAGAVAYTYEDAAGFRKGDTALRQQFNQFLRQLRENGIYTDMVTRWKEQGRAEMPVLEESKDGAPLWIGTVLFGLPYVYMQDNRLVGFDIELMQRFAASIHRLARFSILDAGGLVAALASGKVSAITGIYITDERLQRIDFSDPYMVIDNGFVIAKPSIASDPTAGDTATTRTPVQRGFINALVQRTRSSLIVENRYQLILRGLYVTALITAAAMILGTLVGALVCWCRLSTRGYLRAVAQSYISFLRGTPVVLLLMLIYYVVFAATAVNPVTVAIVAFSLNFSAYFAEILRAGLTSIDPGQNEAALAMGLSPVQAFCFVLLPQVTVQILPIYAGEVISMLKMTSVVGYIAIQDLTMTADIIRGRTYDALFTYVISALIYFVLAWLLTALLARCARQLRRRRREDTARPARLRPTGSTQAPDPHYRQ